MAIAYLMLGSNMGDKHNNLQHAAKAIDREAGKILQSSAEYESEPWGFTNPENFYNQILVIHTDKSPEELLNKLLSIESGMGRIRLASASYESRTIDIDILFYDSLVLESQSLTIPHPRIAERRFVLLPLLEIAPDLHHPLEDKTIWQMYRECKDELKVMKRLRIAEG